MALINDQTGEAVIDGTSTHLVFTAAAFVAAETQLGASTPEIIDRVRRNLAGFRELQVLVAAGMDGYNSREHNGKGATNPTKAMRVIEKAGWYPTLAAVSEAIAASTALGLPGTKDDDGDDDGEDEGLDPGTGPA